MPDRSLESSWLSFNREEEEEKEEESQQRSATTQTLHAPFESFEALGSNAAVSAARTERGRAATEVVHFGTEHGLLCLERAMPDELLHSLGVLADAAVPFKAEALLSQGGGQEECLDTLTDPFIIDASNNLPRSFSTKNYPQEEQGDDVEGRRKNPRRNRLLSPNDQNGSMQDSEESVEALRWLKADVKRIARVFAREISSDPGSGGVTAGRECEEGGGGRGGIIDVTVKLELLRKGKCPRFHLDKVRKVHNSDRPSTDHRSLLHDLDISAQ